MGAVRNTITNLFRKLESKRRIEDIGAAGRIILK
jgi:hypothetical protein